MQIESVPVNTLLPYARNARTHSDAQVAQIAASIKEFSFTNPILIDESSQIIAGHGRLLAARKLEMPDVPCIRLSHLTKSQKKALVIADNKLSLNAGWDNDMLALELGDLKIDGFDLDLTGFNADELAALEALGNSTEEGLTDEDAVPETPCVPVTTLGDMYVLGSHRLLCGSSTDTGAVERLLGEDVVDLVFSDPPYGIDVVKGSVGGSKSFGSKKGSVGGSNIVAANQYAPIIGDETTETAREFFHVRQALGLSNYALWGGNYFTDFLPPQKCWLVWDKKGREWDDNFSDFELAWTSYSKPAKIITHVWMGIVQSGEREKRVHPTQKPTDFIVKCFEYLSPEAKTIYDGFGGSGSTLLACEKTNRRALLMELSPAYCDVILTRWAAATGKDPVREDGAKWSELKPAPKSEKAVSTNATPKQKKKASGKRK